MGTENLDQKVIVCNASYPHGAGVKLVPKVHNPSKMVEFQPISSCNVIYKCITKILANRLQCILTDFISPTQCVFLKKEKHRGKCPIRS